MIKDNYIHLFYSDINQCTTTHSHSLVFSGRLLHLACWSLSRTSAVQQLYTHLVDGCAWVPQEWRANCDNVGHKVFRLTSFRVTRFFTLQSQGWLVEAPPLWSDWMCVSRSFYMLCLQMDNPKNKKERGLAGHSAVGMPESAPYVSCCQHGNVTKPASVPWEKRYSGGSSMS